MKKLSSNKHILMCCFGAILFILWFAYNFNHGELIQHNSGLGWDGAVYADWGQRSTLDVLKSRTVVGYYIQRLLPSAIVHYVSKLTQYDILNVPRIIHAFKIYNFSLLLLSSFVFWRIAKLFKWKLPVVVVGFAAIFLNYPILKYSNYNPTLTDVTAFFLGITTLYCYLSNRVTLLLLTTVAASFTYPSMLYAAMPLIVFPIKNYEVKNVGASKIDVSILFCFSTALIIYVSYLVKSGMIPLRTDVNQINNNLLPVSLLCLFLYIFSSFYNYFDLKYIYSKIIDNFSILRALFFGFLLISSKIFINHFADHTQISPLESFDYLGLIIQSALVNPFTSMVAHIMYWGPVLLLVVFLWNEIIDIIKEKGMGLYLFICFYILLGVGPESRQFINVGSVFAVLACEVLNRHKISWYFAYVFVVVSLVMSRFWLTLNRGAWSSDFLNFPDQMLYMSSGPWMSNTMYLVFLMVIILAGTVIFTMLKVEQLLALQEPCNVVEDTSKITT